MDKDYFIWMLVIVCSVLLVVANHEKRSNEELEKTMLKEYRRCTEDITRLQLKYDSLEVNTESERQSELKKIHTKSAKIENIDDVYYVISVDTIIK